MRLVKSPTIYLKEFFSKILIIFWRPNTILKYFSLSESHDKICSQVNYSFKQLRTEQWATKITFYSLDLAALKFKNIYFNSVNISV